MFKTRWCCSHVLRLSTSAACPNSNTTVAFPRLRYVYNTMVLFPRLRLSTLAACPNSNTTVSFPRLRYVYNTMVLFPRLRFLQHDGVVPTLTVCLQSNGVVPQITVCLPINGPRCCDAHQRVSTSLWGRFHIWDLWWICQERCCNGNSVRQHCNGSV